MVSDHHHSHTVWGQSDQFAHFTIDEAMVIADGIFAPIHVASLHEGMIHAEDDLRHFRADEAIWSLALGEQSAQQGAAKVEPLLSPMRTCFLIGNAGTPATVKEGGEK
jgi:hypothetical protein